jgi:hypothetical protein
MPCLGDTAGKASGHRGWQDELGCGLKWRNTTASSCERQCAGPKGADLGSRRRTYFPAQGFCRRRGKSASDALAVQ